MPRTPILSLLAALALPIAVLPALAACSPHGATALGGKTQAVHPESGLPVIGLTVTHGGEEHRFRVEVARSALEQGRGLMYRTRMGADEGMIFPTDPPHEESFWMRNTVLPLDIIFIGTDGRIITIAANARPYDETPIPSGGLVKGVLELNGGRAQALGIVVGDKVRW